MAWKESPAAEYPHQAGWANGAIQMPFVASGPADVAARINDSLYLSLLGMPAPREPGKTFSPPSGTSPVGTASLEFSVSRNDARILSVQTDAEGCGAYCENYAQEFIFDARSGRSVVAADLFTPKGLGVVAQRMKKERQRQYKAQIVILGKELKALRAQRKPSTRSAPDDIEERIALNEDCLAKLREQTESRQPQTPDTLRDEARYYRLALPLDKGAVFVSSRCSAHVNRALDDVGEVALTIPPTELPALLTPYGISLLLGEGEAPAPASPFGQILRGKVGGAQVTMLLNVPYSDGSFGGRYYYDRYRKPLELSGRAKGKRVELTEHVEDKAQATFDLSSSGPGLIGRWKGNGKDLPVDLRW